ncbi:MAG: hypothetical protein JW702_11695 [Clostridiales bacterium]|nr:hypothetical protein [Clostridiales bacterium]
MKTNLLISVLLLFLISCKKDDNSGPDLFSNTISFKFSFYTDPNPIAISIETKHGFIYVPTNNSNSKIQKFNIQGELLKTLVEFSSFNKGKYSRYAPIDICIGNNNIYILVKPYKPHIDDSWFPYEGFCILQFDLNDIFQKEYDFAQSEPINYLSSMAYLNKYIYLTNGQIIKKISLESEQIIDIIIPTDEDSISTWPDIHTTDMEIGSNGIFYLVGQAAFPDTTLGCHITKINPQINERITKYSQGRSLELYAMLNNPGLALDTYDNIYLATFYCKSLEIFNSDVEIIKDIDIQENSNDHTRPLDVGLYNDQIYILDGFNNIVLVYRID